MIAAFIQLGLYFFQVIFYGTILSLSLWMLRKLLPRGKIGDYHKRYVLITGCDSGFGKETAIRLDQMGFHVCATCLTRDGEENLRAVCSERLKTLHLDVTKSEMIQDVYKQVKKMIPSGTGLWGLVNNAGIILWAPIEWQPLERFKQLADVNLWGLIDVTKTFLPLVKLARGRLVNFSSVSGGFSFPFLASYSVTKYGVEAFSDALRREMRPWDVKVAMIEPGAFKTPLTNEAGHERRLKELWIELSDSLKREYGADITQRYVKHIKTSHMFLSPKTYKVVDSVVDALTSQSPQTRYVVGLDSQLISRILIPLVPATLADKFIGLFFQGTSPGDKME